MYKLLSAPRQILAIAACIGLFSAPFVAPALAGDVKLPRKAPIPERRVTPDEPAEDTGTPPLPSPRPSVEEPVKPEETGKTSPSDGPAMGQKDKTTKQTDRKKEGKPAPLSSEETACRARLSKLGVKFEERNPLSDDAGCSVPHPIAITSLGKDIALEPEAIVNCALAETAAKFFQEKVRPSVRQHFKRKLSTIRHASAYVCRPRNGTSKLSEHAFGNALDIAAFVFDDGSDIEVKSYGTSKEDAPKGNFLAEIRSAACGPFKTVLGPGTDADHATHFHLDLAERRNGSSYCR